MKYHQILQRLQHMNQAIGYKLQLENIITLQKLLHSPDSHYPIIHITGTNGKGSVAEKLSQILQLSGYTVGKYTSPHFQSVRETIQVNQTMISPKEFEQVMTTVFSTCDTYGCSASVFECITIAAFEYFRLKKVDVAVVEVGMGGRLDATNIVSSTVLSIITSLSLDHTTILGNSISEIAREKGGIIRDGVPVLLGPSACVSELFEIATLKKAPIVKVDPVQGNFEEENQQIVRTAVSVLRNGCGFVIPIEAVEKGIKSVPPCRFEVIRMGNGAPVILDCANNPDGIRKTILRVKKEFPNHEILMLSGISSNKDITACLKAMLESGSKSYYFIRSENRRGAKVKQLANEMKALCKNVSITYSRDAKHGETIRKALKDTDKNKVLLVCGSFFIISQVRKQMGLPVIEDDPFADLN